jgi:Big-like domain-containing protein
MMEHAVQSSALKPWFRVATVFLALGLSTNMLGARSLTLAWDPSPGPYVIGYMLYYGEASTLYTEALDVGNRTNATVLALAEGHRYYFAVSAYIASGLESDLSSEVQYTVPGGAFNNQPIGNESSISLPEDQSVALELSGSDPDGDHLSYRIVTAPMHGSLSGQAPDFIYTPQSDFFGEDRFTFIVNDGFLNSLIANVSIMVTPVDDSPVVSSFAVTTARDTPVQVMLGGVDPDAGFLTYSFGNPMRGTLDGTPPDLTYTPGPGFAGMDSFVFVANNGLRESDYATVSITVTSVNTAPMISSIPDQVTMQNVATAAIPFVVGDAQGASSSLTLSGVSSNPTLVSDASIVFGGSDANRSVTVTPALNQTGRVTIIVTVSDGSLSASQSFLVTVNAGGPVNPVCLTLEAEAAVLVSPMTIASDINASGGQYIGSTVNDTGLATFSVDIPVAGDYVVWCRVLSPTNWLDSFYVSVDGGTEYSYATAQDRWTNAWQWSSLVINAGPAPRVFQFAAGNHTVVFRGREADTALDQIIVTNDRDFVPAGRAVTGPNTIVSSLTVDPVGIATITWAATAGESYRVFYKTNLSDPTWQALGADVIATGTNALKQDYVTGNRFYGVAQLP